GSRLLTVGQTAALSIMMKKEPPMNVNARAIQPRLLIAEDNDLVCKQLKTCLEAGLGVRVDTTSDGKQALAALKKNYYSIFLTDVQMPHLDGLQLIQEINKLGIPVTTVVFTGHGSKIGRASCRERG